MGLGDYAVRQYDCPRVENNYIREEKLQPRNNETYLLNLLQNNDQDCQKIPVHQGEAATKQLLNGDILLVTTKELNVIYNCIETGFLRVSKNVVIKMFPNCSVEINNETFRYNINNNVQGDVYHLPVLTQLQTEFHPNLQKLNFTKVHLENVDTILQEAKSLSVGSYTNYSVHSTMNSSLAVVALLTLIVILTKTIQ